MPNPIAFSTLGCPAWDLKRIIAAAGEYGYDAVELRGYLDVVDLPLAEPFRIANIAETRTRFADAGVAVCCVSSSGVVTKGNIDHVRAHAEVAAGLGCPIVRIFGGAMDPALPRAEAFASAVSNLRAFANAAQEAGVGLVLETHDSFSVGRRVAELISAAGHPNVRSLWDL
ncbi:MAG TPA: TIM barrel protein, partial [Chthonomonadaceae bacterium]|nr:TIM barrel protein [Chthonomonadaceae bacterium]